MDTDSSPRMKWALLITVCTLLLTLTFLGGYIVGAKLERTTAEKRVSTLSSEVFECEISLEQLCSGKRLRAGTCEGKIQMCVCASDKEVENFGF